MFDNLVWFTKTLEVVYCNDKCLYMREHVEHHRVDKQQTRVHDDNLVLRKDMIESDKNVVDCDSQTTITEQKKIVPKKWVPVIKKLFSSGMPADNKQQLVYSI